MLFTLLTLWEISIYSLVKVARSKKSFQSIKMVQFSTGFTNCSKSKRKSSIFSIACESRCLYEFENGIKVADPKVWKSYSS